MSLRLLAAVVSIAVLCANPASAGETKVVFEERGLQKLGITPARGRTRNLTFEHTARRDVSGTPDLMDVETVTVVGGVIFVERARPRAAELACPAVEIDLAQGKRASSTRRLRRGSGRGHALRLGNCTLGGVRQERVRRPVHLHGRPRRIPQVVRRQSRGFQLFLLDAFRSLRNPARAHLAVETTIPGYTSNREVTEANEAAARKLERWMRKSHLMFTDLDVDFVFHGADGRVGHRRRSVLDCRTEPDWRCGSHQRPLRRLGDHADGEPGGVRQRLSPGQVARRSSAISRPTARRGGRPLQGGIANAKRELDLYTFALREMPYAVR